MKIYRIPSLFLSFFLIFFTGCEDDDFTAVDLPSEVGDIQLNLSISNDDSGDVTASATGAGFIAFNFLFGEVEGEEPTLVTAGRDVTYTYPEGTFTMTVTGISPAGITEVVTTQEIVVSFTPPTNLTTDIQIDDRNVTVIPSADDATSFEVFFGDVENEEPRMIMAGGQAEHVYQVDSTFVIRTIARSASVNTLERTDTVTVRLTETLRVPVDFESEATGLQFVAFGGASSVVVDNPVSGGVNTSSRVAFGNKSSGAETFAGSFFELDEPINFSLGGRISLDFYSPNVDAVVKLRLEPAGGSESLGIEVDARTTVADEWETLVYDFRGFDLNAVPFVRVVVFFDFGNVGDNTDYFFDNIRQIENEAVAMLPEGFEAAEEGFELLVFGGAANPSVVPNPASSGINTSANVVSVLKADNSETFAGIVVRFPESVDFSAQQRVQVDVLSPKSGVTISLRAQDEADFNVGLTGDVTNTVVNEWETLTFDLSGIDPSLNLNEIVLFFDNGVQGDGSTYFFDNIRLIN